MRKNRLAGLGTALGLGLLMASCGSNDAEIQEYAKAKGMSTNQAAAFTACAGDFRRNKPRFLARDGQTLMKSVPLEVCDCQSRTIVNIFKSDQYKSHTPFAEYLAKEDRKAPPWVAKKVLKDGVNPKEVGARLERSLKACADTYKSAHKDEPETADLFEFIPAKPPEPKKTADASN